MLEVVELEDLMVEESQEVMEAEVLEDRLEIVMVFLELILPEVVEVELVEILVEALGLVVLVVLVS
jgi:hypothetical protein